METAKSQPTVTSYRRKLGIRWGEMPRRFQDWASDKPHWNDVASFCAIRSSRKPENTTEIPSVISGYVYLIKSGKYYKIGKTNSVGRRNYELGILLPKEPKAIHAIATDDPGGIEAYWHKRFEAKKTRSEWFDLSPDDVKAFKSKKSM